MIKKILTLALAMLLLGSVYASDARPLSQYDRMIREIRTRSPQPCKRCSSERVSTTLKPLRRELQSVRSCLQVSLL
jgi:hypothetical protein